MKTWSTAALVLSSADSNHDRIVRLLTIEDQVIPAIAPFARKSTRRFGDRIQPITGVQVSLKSKPTWQLARLTAASTLEVFAGIKGDLLRLGLASSMGEVVLNLVAEHAAEPGMHDLLHKAWAYLDDPAHRPSEALLVLFELRALAQAGVLPPPESLAGISETACEVLTSWLSGQWRPMPDEDIRPVGLALEVLVSDFSGRRLKSRAFLNDVLSTASSPSDD